MVICPERGSASGRHLASLSLIVINYLHYHPIDFKITIKPSMNTTIYVFFFEKRYLILITLLVFPLRA